MLCALAQQQSKSISLLMNYDNPESTGIISLRNSAATRCNFRNKKFSNETKERKPGRSLRRPFLPPVSLEESPLPRFSQPSARFIAISSLLRVLKKKKRRRRRPCYNSRYTWRVAALDELRKCRLQSGVFPLSLSLSLPPPSLSRHFLTFVLSRRRVVVQRERS